MISVGTARRAEEFAAIVDGGATSGARDASLLEFVAALRQTVPVEARADFVADLRSRLMAEADTALSPTDARLTLPVRTRTRRDRRIAVAAGIAVFVGGTSSMAVAAQNALPGDALYPIKRILESAETSLTVDDEQRATQMLDNATGRLAEAEALALRNNAESHAALPDTLDEFVEQANDAADILLEEYEQTGDTESIEELRSFTEDSLSMLTDLSAVIPDTLRGLVAWAVEQLAAIDERAQAACPTCLGGITEIPSNLISGSLLPVTAVAPQATLEPEKATESDLGELVGPLLEEPVVEEPTGDNETPVVEEEDPVKEIAKDVLGDGKTVGPLGGLLDPVLIAALDPLLGENGLLNLNKQED